ANVFCPIYALRYRNSEATST
ncbi:hypothetical protein CP8484711_1863B, partial [Chlamydia psittaci 84-8471/1]